jgi:HSP20 family protein
MQTVAEEGGLIMANISVRKESENRPAQVTGYEHGRWDPFRMMRDLMGFDPFREMAPFAQPMGTNFMPSFDVKETKEAYIFKADVPGVKDSDIEVSVTGNRLNISGKRESEHKEQTDTYYAYERAYGDFTRSFTLPEGADTQSTIADLKDGVLTLTVKKMPEMQPKKIAIQSQQSAAKKS